MSYSNIVRFLGAGAVGAGFAATVLLLIGAFRGGAVLALACVACAVCLSLVMIRHQSWVTATSFRSLGKRLETTQNKVFGLETVVREQAILMHGLEERTVWLRNLETRLNALDAVPESLDAVSGAIAATQSAVLENTSSMGYIEGRAEEIRENLDSLSKTADTITVGVSALRSASAARPAVQEDPAGVGSDKAPPARSIPHEDESATGEGVAELRGLSDGIARVLTLGRDPLETDIDGLPTVALLPGAIPSRASLPASVVIVIDESGFSRGVWKSFGGHYDDYLLSELEAVRRLVDDGRVNAITLTSEDTSVRFRGTRSWGVVAVSPTEAGQLLWAAARR